MLKVSDNFPKQTATVLHKAMDKVTDALEKLAVLNVFTVASSTSTAYARS